MNKLWASTLMGALFIFSGTSKILTGKDGSLWGGNVPAWTGWLLLPGGLLLLAFSIRGLLRGEGKERPYTEKDVADAKRCLEQMHLQDHGVLPEYPDAEEKSRENGEKLK